MTTRSSSQGHYLVAATSDSVYVRVIGLATMNNCGPLQDFLDDVRGQGLRQFVFDFGSCQGFDSTFMGILIGFAMPGPRHNGCDWDLPDHGSPGPGDESAADASRVHVILVNVDGDQRKLLTSVGVDRVVDVCREKIDFPSIRLTRLQERQASMEQRLRRVVQAHQTLVRLDESNARKFGAFLSLVKRELESS